MKWVIGSFAAITALSCLGWIAHAILYPADQAERVMEQTFNADNMIYNYEYFHNKLADFDTSTANVRIKQEEYDGFLRSAGVRSSWDVATQREDRQLRIELDGLRAQRVEIANEYNAHVGMRNRNLFRERYLPEHLDATAP